MAGWRKGLNTAGWLDPGASEGLLGRMGAVHAVVRADLVSGGGRSHGTVLPFRIARACRWAIDLGRQQLVLGGKVHETLRHQCHSRRRGCAGLVFHDLWERWPSVCSFLGTSSPRTAGLGADPSRRWAATRKNLRRDSDGPGNGPPALGDQRGSEWRTSSPSLRKQHHHGSQRSDRLGSRIPYGRHRRPCALVPWENQERWSSRHSKVGAHLGSTATSLHIAFRIMILGDPEESSGC